MKITEMSKQDFALVPYLDIYSDWEKLAPNGHLEFNSLVVIPVENEDGAINLHDSGWGNMEFCLINEDDEPIGKVGGCSDVVNLDGIGGYGADWISKYDKLPNHIPIHGWSLDLLPCGYLRVFARKHLFINDRLICSNMEVFTEDS
jgi:hypothetical protein